METLPAESSVACRNNAPTNVILQTVRQLFLLLHLTGGTRPCLLLRLAAGRLSIVPHTGLLKGQRDCFYRIESTT